jgi:hypothetical protein
LRGQYVALEWEKSSANTMVNASSLQSRIDALPRA